MKQIRKAVFPVAGLGTRFLPATKAMPKELLPIIDKPIIQYAVEEAISAGIDTLIFVTGKNKRAIEDHFDMNIELENTLMSKGMSQQYEMVKNIIPEHIECIFVRQSIQLGLGHAILCAQRAVGNEPFAVLLADDLMIQDSSVPIKDLIEIFKQEKNSVISVAEVDKEEIGNYGIIKPVERKILDKYYISEIIEKPNPNDAPSNLASFGRYVFKAEIFKVLSSLSPGINDEIQLADAINILAKRGKVLVSEFKGKRFDCGNKFGFVEATLHFAMQNIDFKNKMKVLIESLIK